jgi:oligoendopeptidase F
VEDTRHNAKQKNDVVRRITKSEEVMFELEELRRKSWKTLRKLELKVLLKEYEVIVRQHYNYVDQKNLADLRDEQEEQRELQLQAQKAIDALRNQRRRVRESRSDVYSGSSGSSSRKKRRRLKKIVVSSDEESGEDLAATKEQDDLFESDEDADMSDVCTSSSSLTKTLGGLQVSK